jgi:hypothetical protein
LEEWKKGDPGVAFTLTNLPRSVLGVAGKSGVFAVGAER